LLISKPILQLYDVNKDRCLFVDASKLQVGAVLKQADDNGILHSTVYSEEFFFFVCLLDLEFVHLEAILNTIQKQFLLDYIFTFISKVSASGMDVCSRLESALISMSHSN
jgi:hypothetical protein